ncbi:hypothetical protein BDZ89DRAFT_1147997 [Hymenopellis radicata]|nr:hypothetical protein BDZ89DRAFT_1147997 [Hymenopellis radicata]
MSIYGTYPEALHQATDDVLSGYHPYYEDLDNLIVDDIEIQNLFHRLVHPWQPVTPKASQGIQTGPNDTPRLRATPYLQLPIAVLSNVAFYPPRSVISNMQARLKHRIVPAALGCPYDMQNCLSALPIPMHRSRHTAKV